MRVHVKRVAKMPHNVRLWVDDDQPGVRIIWMLKALITEEGARLLEAVYNAGHEAGSQNVRLRLHARAS